MDDWTAKEKELGKPIQRDDEDNVEFRMRVLAWKRAQKKLGPPAAQAAPAPPPDAKEQDSTNRRKYIDEKMKEFGE